jgi:hypothetical protein
MSVHLILQAQEKKGQTQEGVEGRNGKTATVGLLMGLWVEDRQTVLTIKSPTPVHRTSLSP